MKIKTSQPSLRFPATIAVAATAVLLLLSIIFYKERALFADASYILFCIINFDSLAIQVHRYGSFISQAFPYIGQKMHLSIGQLAFLYGISFHAFYLSAISVVVFVRRQYQLAILMAFFYFLLASASFMWTNEISQGITWMFLSLAMIIGPHSTGYRWNIRLLAFLVFAFLAIWTHFAVLIPFTYLWVYFIVEKDKLYLKLSQMITLSLLFSAIAISKYIFTLNSVDAYDINALHGITKFSLSDIGSSLDTAVIKVFLQRCLSNYWAAAAIFISGMAALVARKNVLLFIWTLVSTFGYFLIMGITFGTTPADVLFFHIESEWLSLAVIIAAPFTFVILPHISVRLSAILLTGVFIARITYIFINIAPFTAHYQFQRQVVALMREKGITKLALQRTPKLHADNMLDWGFPFESIIQSKIDGDSTQRSFTFYDPLNDNEVKNIDTCTGIIIVWANLPPAELNSKYFRADTSRYIKLNYDQLLNYHANKH